MKDDFNAGSVVKMRELLNKLNDIEGQKIAWMSLALLTGIYVAYKVTREW